MKPVHVLAAFALSVSPVFGSPVQDKSRPTKEALAKPAATFKSPSIDAAVFARRVLNTADVVLKRHVDPPTRQEMIAGAIKAMHKKANQPQAVGIGRRVSLATRDDDLLQLLERAWVDAHTSAQILDEELQAAALEGLFSQVPDRPHLMPPKEAKVHEQIRSNRYVGIGIQLAMKPGDGGQWPVIINPFPRGPARLAGAKPGDVILEVDGGSTEGKSLDLVVNMLRGEEGSPVTIIVQANQSDEKRTLDMTRGVIPFQSFAGFRRVAEDDWNYRPNDSEPIGYLQMTAIRASTLSELRRLAPTLEAQGIQGLVLDLRNAAPGGGIDVQHVVLLADELLDEGPIGRMVDYIGTPREYRSGPDCLFRRWPIVVLVNQYTFGEAEFLAAALQDNHRAVIVGELTRGRAFVHSAVELPDGLGTVVLRSGLLQRADGRPLQRDTEPDQPDEAFAAPAARTVPDAPGSAPKPTRPQFVQPAGSAPPQQVEIPVGDQKLRLRVGGQPASSRDSREAPGEGGVRPDHVVAKTPDQLRAWMQWRQEQELPEPPAKGGSPPPADPQLGKALEILRAALKDAVQ